MFLVICVGWIARRRGYLGAEVSGLLSRLVVDVALPALVFTQMLKTVDATVLRQNWQCPVLGICAIVLGYLVARPLVPLFCTKEQRHTFLFLAAVPNWIFLPLPIAEALFGDRGIRVTLLYNIGAQLTLWSFGIWVIDGGKAVRQALRNLLSNVTLWATAFGIIVALLFPSTRGLENLNPHDSSIFQLSGGMIVQALAMIGNLTIPLSLLSIGTQLGGLEVPFHHLSKSLWGLIVTRLLIVPVITFAIVFGISKCGILIPDVPRIVGYLIVMMPVGISCSVIVERYRGDSNLAAQSIFYSTFFSLLTVPVLFYVVQRFGL